MLGGQAFESLALLGYFNLKDEPGPRDEKCLCFISCSVWTKARTWNHGGIFAASEILAQTHSAYHEIILVSDRASAIVLSLDGMPPPSPRVIVVAGLYLPPGKTPVWIPDTEFLPSTLDAMTNDDTLPPAAFQFSETLGAWPTRETFSEAALFTFCLHVIKTLGVWLSMQQLCNDFDFGVVDGALHESL
jgi:hypothetical protein